MTFIWISNQLGHVLQHPYSLANPKFPFSFHKVTPVIRFFFWTNTCDKVGKVGKRVFLKDFFFLKKNTHTHKWY